jgi:hypothetical protein
MGKFITKHLKRDLGKEEDQVLEQVLEVIKLVHRSELRDIMRWKDMINQGEL